MENAASRNLHSVKSYGAVPSLHHAKSLGGSRKSSKSQEASKSQLANWYTEAYHYYRAVTNGEVSKPDAAKWDDFILQMNWAYSQINEGGNIGASSDGVNLDGEEETTEADPFGGIPGTQNNLVYNSLKAKIGFTGETRAHDIWSNDVTIDVGTLSANVTSEITTDGRYVPAENVLKIIVKDPATGTESVYYVHDYKDATIKINTPKESQLKSKAPGVTWGEWTEASDASESASSGDAPDKADATHRVWNTKDRVNYIVTEGKETDQIFADRVDITVQNRSQKVYVTQRGEHSYLIEIEDETGKVIRRIETSQVDDVYFHGVDADNLFYKQSIASDSTPPSSSKKAEKVKLGGVEKLGLDLAIEGKTSRKGFVSWSEADSSDPQIHVGDDKDTEETDKSKTLNPKYEDDTEPSRIEGKKAYFENPGDKEISLHANYADKVNEYHITNVGEITLSAPNVSDTVYVTKLEDGSYKVEFHKNGSDKPQDIETFYMDGPPSKIHLNAIPGKVFYQVKEKGLSPKNLPYKTGMDKKITVSGDEEIPTLTAGKIVTNVPSGGYHTNAALIYAEKFENAFRTNNWDDILSNFKTAPYIDGKFELSSDLDDPGVLAGAKNNVMRKIMTALFKAAGSDEKAFSEVLKQIPTEVRQAMKDWLTARKDEMGETQTGDQWNSAAAAAMIDASFE